MRVDVVMPQMGESIAEGTITRWIKKPGDRVEQDEPIFEISTDKVDAEIPSPVSGVLAEIKNQEGDTVEVNRVVAVIDTDGNAGASTSAAAAEAPAPVNAPAAANPATDTPAAPARGRGKSFVSPVVRRIAAEHGIDPDSIPGTGAGGRVTKKDILAFLAEGGTAAAAPAPAGAPAQPDAPGFQPGKLETRVAMTQMRKIIAEHMIASRRTSAHVHSVFEIDVTRLARLRAKYKQPYIDRHGTKLTYMAFFIKAVCDGLRAWPVVNSSVDGEEIVYKRELNIGMAVALDGGLIVPVIRNADDLSIAGLCKKVNDLAERSRTKKLNPDDVQGGTFTITNPGGFGGLYGLPIINQPQVAILGLGGIEKRPVVIDDAIAIRSMMYIAMSYDHRVVDGAVADQFLAQIKGILENFDESLM
jgi:2-oxoglutarate dehydrogenase E2 component (dihydrolipoamide succinyltransferase)